MIIKTATTTLIVCLAVMLLIVAIAYRITRWVFWLPLNTARHLRG